MTEGLPWGKAFDVAEEIGRAVSNDEITYRIASWMIYNTLAGAPASEVAQHLASRWPDAPNSYFIQIAMDAEQETLSRGLGDLASLKSELAALPKRTPSRLRRKRRLDAATTRALVGPVFDERFRVERNPEFEIESMALEVAICCYGAEPDPIVTAQWLRDSADRIEHDRKLDLGNTTAERMLRDAVMDRLDDGHSRDTVAQWIRATADQLDAKERPQ